MSIDHPCGGKRQLTERAAEIFGKPAEVAAAAIDLQALHAKIGQLALENDFLLVPFGWKARSTRRGC